MMKASRSEKFLKIFFPIFGACIIIISLFTIASWLGLFSFDFLCPSVSMEEWPAYDESYRLDTGGEEPTDEELAYYIATKVPDEYKDGLEKIIIKDRFEAVQLAPATSDAEVKLGGPGSIYNPPYADTIVTAKVFTFEVQLNYAKGVEACSVFKLSPKLVEGTDLGFTMVRVQKKFGEAYEVGNSCYIPIEKYQKYFPDYVIQPET